VASLNGHRGSESSNSKAMTGENFENKMQQSTMESMTAVQVSNSCTLNCHSGKSWMHRI